MNKTKLVCLLTIALCTAQPARLQGGVVTNAVIAVVTVAATTGAWLAYQEEHKDNPEAAKDPKKFAKYCYKRTKYGLNMAKNEFEKWINN